MKHAFFTCLALCLLLLLPGGCSQQAAEDGAADGGAALQEILTIRDQAEEAYTAALAEIAPLEEEDPERFAEEMKRIKMEREGQYDVYTDKLVTHINNNTDDTEALKAYADYLAKFVAPGYMTELGNYIKAVEVYDEALEYDPGNPEIQALRDTAAELRFMSQERFDMVTKNMTFDEVEELCGVANPKHIIEEVKRGKTLTGWYYPREDRGIAGIFFMDGKVYKTDFDSKKAPERRKAGEAQTEE